MHISTPFLRIFTFTSIVSALDTAVHTAAYKSFTSEPTTTYLVKEEFLTQPSQKTTTVNVDIKTSPLDYWAGANYGIYPTLTSYYDFRGEPTTRHTVYVNSAGRTLDEAKYAPPTHAPTTSSTSSLVTSIKRVSTSEETYPTAYKDLGPFSCNIVCKSRTMIVLQRYTIEMHNCTFIQEDMHNIARDICTMTGFTWTERDLYKEASFNCPIFSDGIVTGHFAYLFYHSAHVSSCE